MLPSCGYYLHTSESTLLLHIKDKNTSLTHQSSWRSGHSIGLQADRCRVRPLTLTSLTFIHLSQIHYQYPSSPSPYHNMVIPSNEHTWRKCSGVTEKMEGGSRVERSSCNNNLLSSHDHQGEPSLVQGRIIWGLRGMPNSTVAPSPSVTIT